MIVHERDINTDFLMILLRDLLQKRPDLRLVLMSATLNAQSFADYFSQENDRECKLLSVPTQPRHPVEVFYLEDIEDIAYPAGMRNLAKSLLEWHDLKLLEELEEAELEATEAVKLATKSRDEDSGLLNDSDSDDSDDEDESMSSSAHSRVDTLKRAVSLRQDSGVKKRSSATTSTRKEEREAEESIVKLVAQLVHHLSQSEIDAGRRGSKSTSISAAKGQSATLITCLAHNLHCP